MTFTALNLHTHLLGALEEASFTAPTPIQKEAIPHIISGKDVLACAQTGTGKTAAFTLPAIHRLLEVPREGKGKGPRVVVLTPTRELADQVLASIKTFVKGSKLQAGLVVGGMPYLPQERMLGRTLDILVATPGRLIDHMNQGRVDFSATEMVVLDEADRMLDMGFSKPVEDIMAPMPEHCQTLLFSATFDSAVEKLAKKFLNNPEEIKLAASTQKHENIEQSLYYTNDMHHKLKLLEDILANSEVWQAIIFIRTKHATEDLADKLCSWGHEADALHGDMRQNVRKRVVDKMHKGKIRVLVATDVAARGLDVKELTHVINFDLPQVSEDYIHRIGRTGRAGAKGTAISFVSRMDMGLLRDIEKLLGRSIDALNEAPKKKAGSGGGAKKDGQKRRKPQGKSFSSDGDKPARKKKFPPKKDEKAAGRNGSRSKRDGEGFKKDFKRKDSKPGTKKKFAKPTKGEGKVKSTAKPAAKPESKPKPKAKKGTLSATANVKDVSDMKFKGRGKRKFGAKPKANKRPSARA